MEVLEVSQFIELINETLGFAYPNVVIEGEVSGFSVRQNKWVFFDLKDAEGTISCFATTYQLKTPLEDGMKVRVSANPKLTKWGKFSVTVQNVELAGEGALKRAYELLQAKLEAEGLFAAERKRELPRFPRRIGLIASTDSAAYKDFLKILNARWSGVEVQALDVRVQGESAPEEIVAAIQYFNQLPTPMDVLVITRGGGSLEDLAAFSTEPVARAVAASRTPTIVGVGHEIDTSLSDLVADVRAATPTDAARLVVPDKTEFSASLDATLRRLEQHLNRLVAEEQAQLRNYMHRLERFITMPKDRLLHMEIQLQRQFERLCDRVGRNQQQVASLARTLTNLDPRTVLKRGYAIARLNGAIVRAGSQVAIGDSLMVQLAESELETEVKDVKKRGF